MQFKLCMIVGPWGLLLLLGAPLVTPYVGLSSSSAAILLVRIIGLVVLAVLPFYFYIYKKPATAWARRLMLAAVVDNGGLGILLLILSVQFHLSWIAFLNAGILLFFAYWFGRFYEESST